MRGLPTDGLQAPRGAVTLFLSVEEEPDRPVTRPRAASRAWEYLGVLLMLLHIALLIAVVPQLTVAEALWLLGPQVLQWLGSRGLGWSGGTARELEQLT